MIASSFEIKIALLGNVSAGKTTVLNALLRDKYGQTSMKRATAGVSYFRVHTSPSLSASNKQKSQENLQEVEEDGTRSAKSTLEEISQDNVKFREGKTVMEKCFDVQLQSEFVPMLQDAQLVFVDIPGINEANTEHKYKDFVSEKWDTFDMVVVVMDARQGVNTEDSVFLLNLVKKNNDTKKNIPVIILCNKVDDPEDQEQAEMVTEARKEVEKIFNVGCRDQALKHITGALKKFKGACSPVFIPMSAVNAYVHQSASLMSRESFEDFDQDLLEKLGREQLGRQKWNKLSKKEKLDAVHELIKENYQEGLQSCNFDKVLKAFSFFLGGESKQLEIIEKQIKTALFRLSKQPTPGKISIAVKQVHDSSKMLLHASKTNKSVLQFVKKIDPVEEFWKAYSQLEDQAFDEFKASWPTGFHNLAGPMSELETYFHYAKLPEWNDNATHVLTKMKKLIRRFFSFLLDSQEKDITVSFDKASTVMTPLDWSLVWRSILLLSFDRNFCLSFGKEKVIFEHMAQDAHWRAQDTLAGTSKCHYCKRVVSKTQSSCCGYTVNHSQATNYQCIFQPRYNSKHEINPFPEEELDKKLRIPMAEDLSDPSHMAHIVWIYCQCAESLTSKSK